MLGIGIDLASLSKAAIFHDFRAAMPAGSTYTRVGAATALTAAGVIETFAEDAPQRTDRGLALEPAATNLLRRSQEFDNGSYARTNIFGVTANAVIAPDGTTTADTVVASTANAQHRLDQTPVSSAGTQTYSIFGVPTGYGFVTQRLGTVGSGVVFDLNTGTIVGNEAGVTPSLLAVSRSFYRSAVAITGVAANAIARVNISPTSNVTFAGDDVSGVTLWQAQLELGSVATSPIVTTGTTASRSLPVFTEPVPAGHTRALLTYADATTTLVTGLTPGGTLDVATAVIGASKGRFGASELVSRTWLP
jgi:hypothetical protein